MVSSNITGTASGSPSNQPAVGAGAHEDRIVISSSFNGTLAIMGWEEREESTVPQHFETDEGHRRGSSGRWPEYPPGHGVETRSQTAGLANCLLG
jgi:hypothetical protein